VTGKKEFFKKIFDSLWACVRARGFNASGDPEHSIPVQRGGYHIQVFVVVPEQVLDAAVGIVFCGKTLDFNPLLTSQFSNQKRQNISLRLYSAAHFQFSNNRHSLSPRRYRRFPTVPTGDSMLQLISPFVPSSN